MGGCGFGPVGWPLQIFRLKFALHEGFYIKAPLSTVQNHRTNPSILPQTSPLLRYLNSNMRSFSAIVAVLTSALLVSVQAVPQGQAAPQAKAVPQAQAAKAQTATQSCWKCPSDQGLFKFQQQAGSDPLHCQFLKDGVAYYCDYKVVSNDSSYSYHCIIY